MERRDFLALSAVAGSAAVLWPPRLEADPGQLPPDVSAAEMDRLLAHLDLTTARSRQARFLEPFLPPRQAPVPDEEAARVRRREELLGQTLRSLLMVGTFHDLPERGRVHPGMQARMWAAADEIDDTVRRMTDLLGGMSPAERLDLSRMFREEPDLPMRLMEILDAQAAHAGISARRRVQLRRMTAHLSWRLRHQGATAVIDEYVGEVRQALAREGLGEVVQRRMMAKLGERAFWAQQDRLAALALSWDQAGDPYAPGGAFSGLPASTPAGRPPQAPTPGRRLVRAGLITLGVGLGAGALGGILFAFPVTVFISFGLFTVSALLLLSGIIVIIVGAAKGT